MSWPHVDYDTDLWMKLPDAWETTPWKGPKQWARHMSEAWWGDSDLEPTRKDLKALAATLRACAEQFPGSHPGFDVYLHLPDPRLMPLPVYVAAVEADGDREETLPCFLALGDGSGTVSRLADETETRQLTEGLDVLRSARRLLDDPVSPNAEVRYTAIRLTECLADALRIAESRGRRLPQPGVDEGACS